MPRKATSGLQCPACKHGVSYICDARGHDTYFRRRRRCAKCNHRWTTYETEIALVRGRPKGSGGQMDMSALDEIRKSKEPREYVEPDDFDDDD